MRVVVCGDSHIGATFGLGKSNGSGGNTRIDDYEKSLNYIVDYCILNKVDAFVQTGDIFESRSPTPEHMEIVDNALKKLSDANITSAIIMGNHDYRRSGDSFTSAISSLPAKNYPNVRLVLEPQNILISNDLGEGINVVLVPYRDRRMYDGENIKEQSQKYNAHIKSIVDSISNKHPIMSVGHNFFYEGSYNDYGGTEILASVNAFSDCNIAIMGHLHTFRELQSKATKAIYIGSMEKVNFGDENLDKFFIDYCSKSDITEYKKVPTRELLSIEIDLRDSDVSNVNENIDKVLGELDIQDKIIKIKLTLNEQLLSSINKSSIEKTAYSLGAFVVSRVIVETIASRIIRDTSILSKKDDFSMFSAFVEAQGLGKNIKENILSEAKIIMNNKDG
tara:strand:+ start:3598 stop:4773 length:1176 start_codon:yes stop_codon:yes gene_type:complete